MSNIILAEDDTTLRHFIKASLEKAGHSVTAFDNGRDACHALENGEVCDLLLTDIVMPGMDGIELSTRAAALKSPPKIMFITGFAGMAVQDDGHENAPIIISKPFHLGNLLAEIEKILNP